VAIVVLWVVLQLVCNVVVDLKGRKEGSVKMAQLEIENQSHSLVIVR
jgi:hypothetical protein